MGYFWAGVAVAVCTLISISWLLHRLQLKVRELAKPANTRTDIIYGAMDNLFRAKDFALADLLVMTTPVHSLSSDELIALLTATLPARSKLTARRDLYVQVAEELKERGDWEDGLLDGLE